MASYSFAFLLLFSVASAACYIAYDFFIRQNRVPPGTKRLPGPKGVPILGSVPQLPKKDIFLKFSEWRQEYGPIYQVNLIGTNYVWLSSHKVADDLLGKRSNIYCHRPRMATGHDNRTSMHYLPLMNYCDEYVRGINFKRWLLQSTKDRLKTLASQEAKTMVLKLQAHPANYKQHIERCCAGISTRMAWNDASPSSIEETLYVSNALLYRISPDGEITMKLPILRRIPEWVPNWLQPWKVAEIARYERERDFWFDRKNKVASQELAGPSWMQKALESKEKVQLNDIELGYAVGMMALIGGVLVSSPLQSFFLCMCLFPDWQVKAQEELDMVCGDRVPQFEDIQSLPVVRAIIREVFRWRTPLPVGVPHVTDCDDIYEGYHIPKGSVCFSLEWSLNQDPTLYPEPQAFKPERWLDPNFPTYKEPLAYYPSLKGHSGFGWGRRACPGQDYCEIVHFTTIATTLWSSRISNKKDPITGEDILPPLLGTSFVIVRPNWWAFDVVARDERKVEALRD